MRQEFVCFRGLEEEKRTVNAPERHAGAGTNEGRECLAVGGDELAPLSRVHLALVEVEDEVIIFGKEGEAVCSTAKLSGDAYKIEKESRSILTGLKAGVGPSGLVLLASHAGPVPEQRLRTRQMPRGWLRGLS